MLLILVSGAPMYAVMIYQTLVVLATATGAARVGPLVFWAVHREEVAGGSEVALRPGLGLPVLWLLVLAVAAALSRRRDV